VSLVAGAAAVAVVAGGTAVGVTARSGAAPGDPAQVSGPTASLVGGKNQQGRAAARAVAPSLKGNDKKAVFLAALLNGQNEAPQQDGAGGDVDGHAVSILRITGNQICYSFAWSGIGAPTLGNVHAAKNGVVGDPVVNLFSKAMPENARAAAGCVDVGDAQAAGIAKKPGNFVVNLQTAEFADGAVRGQYRRLDEPVRLDDFVDGQLLSVGNGAAVVPERGDPKAGFVGVVTPESGQVKFAVKLFGTTRPTSGRLNVGGKDVAGEPAVDLFEVPDGLAPELFAISGVTAVENVKLLQLLSEQPGEFNLSLFSPQFPKGLARGQLELNGRVQATSQTDGAQGTGANGTTDSADPSPTAAPVRSMPSSDDGTAGSF
jgi:hypothetical protein